MLQAGSTKIKLHKEPNCLKSLSLPVRHNFQDCLHHPLVGRCATIYMDFNLICRLVRFLNSGRRQEPSVDFFQVHSFKSSGI
jgi:hypothetical protein